MIEYPSNNYKNIIFRKNFIIKKFKFTKRLNSINEIEGYNYFKNKDVFKLIQRIKIIKKRKSILVYYKRYRTKPSSFFKIQKFYNISKINIKKINSSNYINNLFKQLKKIKNFENKNFILKINNLLKKYKSQTLFISPAHCDFIHYNTLTSDREYYTIDFEFFDKKKIFSYDLYNWYFTPLLTNIKRYKLILFSNILIDIFFYFIKKINFGYQIKINHSLYDEKNLIFYLVEKYLFLFNEKKKNPKKLLYINYLEKLIIKKILSYK